MGRRLLLLVEVTNRLEHIGQCERVTSPKFESRLRLADQKRETFDRARAGLLCAAQKGGRARVVDKLEDALFGAQPKWP